MNAGEIARLLLQEDGFLIVTHRRPDGDTLGSAAGLCLVLRKAGKTAYLFPNEQVTETYQPFVSGLFAPEGFQAACVVTVDVADDSMFAQGFKGHVNVSIDHHPSNPGYADHTLVMPERASCGEIVLLVAREMGVELDADIASMLYIAVSTDTGCFAYGNTNAAAHRAAAEMIEAGARLEVLNKILFRTVSAERLKLEGMIYTGLRRYRDGQINIAVISLEMMRQAGATEDDCDDLAALPGRIKGNKVSVMIRELRENYCKVSVRTGTEADAAAICTVYGGGGHKMAAGCELEAPPDVAADKMLEAINEVWK